MARNRKAYVGILVTAVLAPIAVWFPMFVSKHANFSDAEEATTKAMTYIQRGALRRADEALVRAEEVLRISKGRWPIWPGIRERERELGENLVTSRAAYSKRLALLDTTALKVAQLVSKGNLEEARAIISVALGEAGTGDQSIEALSRMLDRLNARDFGAASLAAKQSTSFLSEQVPISEVTKAALPKLAAIVEQARLANDATLERIASAIRKLVDAGSPRESKSFRPMLKGKVIIWDESKNKVDRAYELLPDYLKATSHDRTVTVLSVIQREQVVVGRYSPSGGLAYQEKAVIGVSYWPDKASAGTVVIWGDSPPVIKRVVTYKPGYNPSAREIIRNTQPSFSINQRGSTEHIVDWVKSLPRQ